ncbi:MAG: DUF5329 family protein [Phycisphaerales bacterium]|nr:DUF5329 family protein [Phycisphaerales bacterium]
MHVRLLLLSLATVVLVGCDSEPEPSPDVVEHVKLAQLPVEITVKQRSTTIVPGSSNRLRLTIDDITRNQVMASLATDGTTVLPQTSFSPGLTTTFDFDGTSYALTLRELENTLVGEDFATFVFTATEVVRTETDKIEELIRSIAKLQGAVFIRNDVEYGPAEAAEHLRMKWHVGADKIESAEAFIDYIASHSSVTGGSYLIRMQSGEVVQSSEYLHEQLARMEAED